MARAWHLKYKYIQRKKSLMGKFAFSIKKARLIEVSAQHLDSHSRCIMLPFIYLLVQVWPGTESMSKPKLFTATLEHPR